MKIPSRPFLQLELPLLMSDSQHDSMNATRHLQEDLLPTALPDGWTLREKESGQYYAVVPGTTVATPAYDDPEAASKRAHEKHQSYINQHGAPPSPESEATELAAPQSDTDDDNTEGADADDADAPQPVTDLAMPEPPTAHPEVYDAEADRFVEVPPEEQAYARFLHSMQQAGTLITGLALKAIRDHEIYKKLGCTSFRDYCDTMASVSRKTAYRHVKRAEMYGAFLPDVFSPKHFAQLQTGQGGSPLLQLTSALQGDAPSTSAPSTASSTEGDAPDSDTANAESDTDDTSNAPTDNGPIPRAINGLSGSKLDALGELDDERLRDYITHEKLHTPDGDVITREQIAEMTAREVSRRVGEILEPHKKKAETEKEKRLKAEAERDALKDTLNKKKDEIERSRDIEHTLGPRAARLEEKRDRMSKMEDALREASKQIYKIGLTTDDPIPDQERAMDILAHCQRLADAARDELGEVVLNAELHGDL